MTMTVAMIVTAIITMTVTTTVAMHSLDCDDAYDCCSVVAKGQFRGIIVMYCFIVCKQGGRGGTSENGNAILK